MATGTRLRVNFIDGQLSDALTDAGTTMDSPGLENLPVIDHASDDEYLALSIGSEVVHVTTHTADATSATIERGQEDTDAAAHEEGAAWEHAPTVEDFEEGGGGADDDGNVLSGDATVDVRSMAAHPGATAETAGAIAVGDGATAGGSLSGSTVRAGVAVGYNADAGDNIYAVAIGTDTVVSGNRGIALGGEAAAYGGTAGTSSVAIGNAASAPAAAQRGSVAIGDSAATTDHSAVAIGAEAESDRLSVAVGNGAEATARQAVAVGQATGATHEDSVALGYDVQTSATFQVMVGPRDIEITGIVKGLVLEDRTLGTRHRVYLDDGSMNIEAL